MLDFVQFVERFQSAAPIDVSKKLFEDFDNNRDNYLSYSEWENFCLFLDRQMSQSHISYLFDEIDSNNDTKISPIEI